MDVTPVNPWPWGLDLGINQGIVVEGHTRQLVASGQTAMSADGIPQHAGDMEAQVVLSFDNLEAVLAEAGMTLANVVRLNVYTTDVDAFMGALAAVGDRVASMTFASTLLGVDRLFVPELMVEFEATAVA